METELNQEDIGLDLSYTIFCCYLELGIEASLQEVAEKTGKSYNSVCHLSARNHWMERAAAYRQHVSHAFLTAAYRQRAKQTELSQMRDQILRQSFWEDGQLLRA